MAELAVMALTSAGVSAGTAATIGTIASVGLTAASAFSSIQAGNAEASSLNVSAQQAALSSKQERLRFKQESAAIQNNLIENLASQNAMFGARGMISSEGSALAAQETSRINAAKDIDLARFDTEVVASNYDQQSSNLRSEAKAAKSKGFTDAIGTLSGLQIYGTGSGSTSTSGIPIPRRKPQTMLTGL